jgi:hypothetical protein
MRHENLRLALTINLALGGDSEELETITRQLRKSILELPVESVESPPTTVALGGAKGDAGVAGTLLITLAASGGVITALINAVQSYLSQKRERTPTVTVEVDGDRLTVTGLSSKEGKRLVDAWIARHTSHE